MYVEEKDRSWCTSNKANDMRAVTIEVASDSKHPFAITDAAYQGLIRLLVDICKRNNIKKLLWQGNPALVGQIDKQNMTVHRWFAKKACPGDYLYNKHPQIAADVNELLGQSTNQPIVPNPIPAGIKTTMKVKITASLLNIRSGPSTKYAQIGTVKKDDVCTIVKTSNNWGKLKDSDGWISLNDKYVKVI